jgi:transposase
MRGLWPGLQILDRLALAPLRHGLGVDPQLPAQRRERSLRSLYCCSDGVRGRGAPVTYLSHNASFHSSEWIAPSNRGIKHVTDANGRPLSFFITAGKISDYAGAAALLDDLPKAKWMLADRGYDADWFRDALEKKGVNPCIPSRKSRSLPVKYDKRRNRIEIMFSRLKDYAVWQRDTTAAQPSTSPHSHWPPLCSPGCDQWVLSLGKAVQTRPDRARSHSSPALLAPNPVLLGKVTRPKTRRARSPVLWGKRHFPEATL